MDIDLIFKIAGTGIIVAVLNLVLKRAEREEQAMMTTLAGLIVWYWSSLYRKLVDCLKQSSRCLAYDCRNWNDGCRLHHWGGAGLSVETIL